MTSAFIHYLHDLFVGNETADETPQTAFQRFVRTICRASQERRAASWFRSGSDKLIWNSGNGEGETGRLSISFASIHRLFDDVRLTGLSVVKRRQQLLESGFL